MQGRYRQILFGLSGLPEKNIDSAIDGYACGPQVDFASNIDLMRGGMMSNEEVLQPLKICKDERGELLLEIVKQAQKDNYH
jgi:hypothetical protein